MRGGVGVALVSDLSDLSDLSDKMGAPVFALTGYAVASHVIPLGGVLCRCVVWLGRRCAAGVVQRADLPQGNAGQLDGNGGMRVAWAWRLHGNFWDFLGIFGRVIGAPCDTPWVCGAAVWNSSGEDLPLG